MEQGPSLEGAIVECLEVLKLESKTLLVMDLLIIVRSSYRRYWR